ncbi:tail fiber domain-containing protein [Sinimarinibacterium flocculans]|uniref:tail fiber domain-containing protein n=1 Tax=Sinimarinibacterium flocculans TaxID=985250 RepID=UPI0035122C8B
MNHRQLCKIISVAVLLQASLSWAQDLYGDKACIGADCVNPENFGEDTIRLEDNNLRIKFDDTSNSQGFPYFDWQLVANDSTNGGANRFSIEDVTSATVPFTVEGGAPSQSLFVDGSGRIGFGTLTPLRELHVADGDSPALRLEQDGSSGFAAQAWDVAGNEGDFFVRDVTGGDRLPLRIRAGAPTNALTVDADGDVGVGLQLADASLHIERNDGSARLLVREADRTAAFRRLVVIENNGDPSFMMTDTSTGNQTELRLLGAGGTFSINHVDTGGPEFRVTRAGAMIVGPRGASNMILSKTGTMTLAGTLVQNSDVNAKRSIEPVAGETVLAKLSDLPVSTWEYKSDASGVRHLGPMAQDFHKAFGLGEDPTKIAPGDMAGVALVGLQALAREQDRQLTELRREASEKDHRILELQTQIHALAERLQALESAGR